MKYVPPIGATDPDEGYVTENLAAGIEGSPVAAEAIEHTMREIMAVIVAAGLTPDAEDLTQLAQVIAALADHTHTPASIGAAAASHPHLVAQITDLLSGSHLWSAPQRMTETVLTYAASLVWDMLAVQAATVTLTGDAVLVNPASLPSGRTQYSLLVKQDATGGHTISYGDNFLPTATGGTLPEIATEANAVTLLVMECNGVTIYVGGGV